MTLYFLILTLAFSADKTVEVDKHLVDASHKVCESFYAQFLKDNLAAKKFGAEEKNVLINSCLVRNHAGSQLCAKSMISKVAEMNRRKAKPKEIQEKMKNALQPELQKCFENSNSKSKQEMSELGKLFLAGRKDQVKAKVEAWSKEAK